MRSAQDLLANIGQFPEWYRTHWRSLGRVISDMTELLANGIVYSENVKHELFSVSVGNAESLQLSHNLGRPPLVQCVGGRVVCFKVLSRNASTVTVWTKLPHTYVYPPGNKNAQGSYSKMVCDDAGWFSTGDIVSVDGLRTAVVSSRGGYLTLEFPVLLTGRSKISLYQENADLLLF